MAKLTISRCAELEAENTALGKLCAEQEAGKEYNAELCREKEAENVALKETVQILNNRVRDREGEIQRLREAMPLSSTMYAYAERFGNHGEDSCARGCRFIASHIEAIEKEREK